MRFVELPVGAIFMCVKDANGHRYKKTKPFNAFSYSDNAYCVDEGVNCYVPGHAEVKRVSVNENKTN